VSILDKFRSTFTFGKTGLESEVDSAADAPIKEKERRPNKRMNARDETRALIIDDSPTIVFALKKILQSAGFIWMPTGCEADHSRDRRIRSGIGFARLNGKSAPFIRPHIGSELVRPWSLEFRPCNRRAKV
jgi:hypothetical protein